MINIASEFSRFPGGRYRTDGPHSGEEFRERFLTPALNRGEVVTVWLDDVAGLPASFLEEAFGGLVREGFTFEQISKHLKVLANSPRMQRYPELVWGYVRSASTSAKSAH